MNLRTMSKDDSCILIATAILLDLPPLRLMKEIGHDGKEVVFKGGATKGYNVDEIIDVLIQHGVKPVLINKYPVTYSDINYTEEHQIWPAEKCRKRFDNYMRRYRGILIGLVHTTCHHAVAWDREKIYDPRGYIDPTDFEILYGLFCV